MIYLKEDVKNLCDGIFRKDFRTICEFKTAISVVRSIFTILAMYTMAPCINLISRQEMKEHARIEK